MTSTKNTLPKLLVYSNMYNVFCMAALLYVSSIVLTGEPHLRLLVIAMLMTWSMYTLNRTGDVKEDMVNRPDRAQLIRRYATVLRLLAIACYGAALGLSFVSGRWAFVVPVAILILGIAYSFAWIPVRNREDRRRLKDITLVKNVIISAAVASTAVLLPGLHTSDTLASAVLALFVFVFLRVFVNTVVFDIRDIEGDRSADVNTIPVVYGIRKTKSLLYILNLAVALVVVVSVMSDVLPRLAYFLLPSSLYAHAYIVLADHVRFNRGLLFDIVVDGECLFILGCVVLGAFLMA